ncbi:hypothetical protein [uncultured Brachyspira sp.]|uniref:hypothetical protein n=1 Tax=uncultured Brachyspira sp. TaxID=221953 RepID=UPI0026069E5E|nr:hypothetical protein [uncultured Brachyspira sp.]
MELYQELFNDYLKEYYKTLEELLNCLENNDKEKFQINIEPFIYKEDNEAEYIKDKNYIERLKLILSILYHKNRNKLMSKKSFEDLLVFLFEEEIKDRQTNSYQGIGTSLEIMSFLFVKLYNDDINKLLSKYKDLFDKAKNANFDCNCGYGVDDYDYYNERLDELSIDAVISYFIDIDDLQLCSKFIDIWKETVKEWDKKNLDKLKYYESLIEDKESLLETTKKLFEMAVKENESNWDIVSALNNYLKSLIENKKYDYAWQLISKYMNNIKNIQDDKFYNINLGRYIIERAADIMININNEKLEKEIWSFISEPFTEEHHSFYLKLYEKVLLCCDIVRDEKLKNKISEEYQKELKKLKLY